MDPVGKLCLAFRNHSQVHVEGTVPVSTKQNSQLLTGTHLEEKALKKTHKRNNKRKWKKNRTFTCKKLPRTVKTETIARNT